MEVREQVARECLDRKSASPENWPLLRFTHSMLSVMPFPLSHPEGAIPKVLWQCERFRTLRLHTVAAFPLL